MSHVANVFCPTGEGGGVDPSCSTSGTKVGTLPGRSDVTYSVKETRRGVKKEVDVVVVALYKKGAGGYAAGEHYLTSKAHPPEGHTESDMIGFTALRPNKDGTFFVTQVHVDESHRRQGLASAMYDLAMEGGIALGKSPIQTDLGDKFRTAYSAKKGVVRNAMDTLDEVAQLGFSEYRLRRLSLDLADPVDPRTHPLADEVAEYAGRAHHPLALNAMALAVRTHVGEVVDHDAHTAPLVTNGFAEPMPGGIAEVLPGLNGWALSDPWPMEMWPIHFQEWRFARNTMSAAVSSWDVREGWCAAVANAAHNGDLTLLGGLFKLTGVWNYDPKQPRGKGGQWTKHASGWFDFDTASAIKAASRGEDLSKHVTTGGESLSGADQKKYEEAADVIQRHASEARTPHTTLYRGQVLPDDRAKALVPGASHTFDSLTAAAVDRGVADIYTNRENFGGEGTPVLFHVKSAAGLRGVEIPSSHDHPGGEVIMPKGASFTVSKVEDVKGVKHVHLSESGGSHPHADAVMKAAAEVGHDPAKIARVLYRQKINLSAEQVEQLLTANFDASQKRAKDGKWTKGSAEHASAKSSLSGLVDSAKSQGFMTGHDAAKMVEWLGKMPSADLHEVRAKLTGKKGKVSKAAVVKHLTEYAKQLDPAVTPAARHALTAVVKSNLEKHPSLAPLVSGGKVIAEQAKKLISPGTGQFDYLVKAGVLHVEGGKVRLAGAEPSKPAAKASTFEGMPTYTGPDQSAPKKGALEGFKAKFHQFSTWFAKKTGDQAWLDKNPVRNVNDDQLDALFEAILTAVEDGDYEGLGALVSMLGDDAPTANYNPLQPRDKNGRFAKVPNPLNVKFIKNLGGHGPNPAKLVEDADGNKWVMKAGGSKEHLVNEVVADEAYRRLGLNVPAGGLHVAEDGTVTKFTKFLEGGQTLKEWEDGKTPAQKEAMNAEIAKGFAADAFMGNWDVVGATKDNIMITPDGKVWRIDNGGALEYRAQGKKKAPGEFDGTVKDLKTMLDPSVNPNAATVFGSLTPNQILSQVQGLEEKLEGKFFNAFETNEALKLKMMARFTDIHKQANAMQTAGVGPGKGKYSTLGETVIHTATSGQINDWGSLQAHVAELAGNDFDAYATAIQDIAKHYGYKKGADLPPSGLIDPHGPSTGPYKGQPAIPKPTISGGLFHGVAAKDIPGWGHLEGKTGVSYGAVLYRKNPQTGEYEVLLRKPTGNFDGYHWTFPKGGHTAGEHPLDTAKKEVGEEVGLDFHPTGHLSDTFKTGHSETAFFVGEAVGKRDLTKMDGETEAIKWVPLSQAGALIGRGTNADGVARDLSIISAFGKQMGADVIPKKAGPAVADMSSPKKAVHLHANKTLADHLQAGSGGMYTEGNYKKVMALNPDGIKNGVFYTPKLASTPQAKAQQAEHLAHLTKLLPPGTVVKQKVMTEKEASDQLAKNPPKVASVGTTTATPVSPPTYKVPEDITDKVKKKATGDTGGEGKVVPMNSWYQPGTAHHTIQKMFAGTHEGMSASELKGVVSKVVADLSQEHKGELKKFLGMQKGEQGTIEKAYQSLLASTGLKPKADPSYSPPPSPAPTPKPAGPGTAGSGAAAKKGPVQKGVFVKPKKTMSVDGVHVVTHADEGAKSSKKPINSVPVSVFAGKAYHQVDEDHLPDMKPDLVPLKSNAAVKVPYTGQYVDKQDVQDWKAKLTGAEKSVIGSWKGSSTQIRMPMYEALKNGQPISQEMQNIASAIQKMAPQPGVYYRGIDSGYSEELIGIAKAALAKGGDNWMYDVAPHGMTTNPKIAAKKFAQGELVLRVASKSARPIHDIHGFEEEAEVIGVPGARYRIKGIHENVTMEWDANELGTKTGSQKVKYVIDVEEI